MQGAYIELYQKGWAHSVEVWDNKELVGGLYGIAIGNTFFGESMFSKTSNASKYGFIKFCQHLNQLNFEIIDCQIHSPHLESLGANFISRKEFENILKSTPAFTKRTFESPLL